MSAALILETFDDTPPFAPAAAEAAASVDPAQSYMAGFADGEASALARLESAEQAFADAARALDEALKALAPTSERALAEALTTLVRELFPVVAERGFAEEASAAIVRAFAGSVSASIEIAARSEQVEALAAALKERRLETPFSITADDSLAAAEARVRAGRGGLDFNLDAAREACLAALAAALNDGKQR